MTKSRLNTESKRLSKILRSASEDDRRDIVLDICKLALAQAKLKDIIFKDAIKVIEKGKPANTELNKKLDQITDMLDEKYFKLQAAYEAGSEPEHKYLIAFKKARAAAAVTMAARDSQITNALDAVYEAYFAIEDESTMLEIANKILQRKRGSSWESVQALRQL